MPIELESLFQHKKDVLIITKLSYYEEMILKHTKFKLIFKTNDILVPNWNLCFL